MSEQRIGVLIVDDEPPARLKLRRLLSAESDFAVVGEASDGQQATRLIRELGPDVVLLDIQMPDMNGFDVLRALGGVTLPRIVFVTAHAEHAVEAFQVRAVDYLLKPVAPKRFRETMARLREDIDQGVPPMKTTDIDTLASLIRGEARGGPRYLSRLIVRTGAHERFLEATHVDWIESDGHALQLHVGRDTHRVRGSLSALAARLDPAHFLRISRTHIVRLSLVRELHPWSHGDYRMVLADGTTLTWSRRFRSETDSAFRLER